ncbi:hypothetical protein V6N13_092702 [Hibiscus sabdariffa]
MEQLLLSDFACHNIECTPVIGSLMEESLHCHCRMPNGLCRGYFARNQSVLSAGSAVTMTQQAQVAWTKLARKCSAGGCTFPCISGIAQAVSLALSRSHLIVPGVLGLACGRVALAQRTSVEPEYYPLNSFSIRAQNGHALVSSLLLSVLEGVILLVRALYLTVLFSPSIIMAPFSYSCGPQFRKKWLEAATRLDLFPIDLCIKLSELHSKAPEHSFAYTKKTIESAFGRKLSEVFKHFEEEPVASGSIAQVHRATLRFRYPGQQVKPMVVAVKVRHPGVGESIKRDFMIINSVAKLSRFIPTLNWLRLDESVQQSGVFMMSQVDLAREAAHLNRFIYNFRRWRDVSFPKPVYPLVHPAVLVETYEQGESVAYYVGHDRIKAALAHIGTHALLKMLLVTTYDWFAYGSHNIHMHPGNILVRVSLNKASRKQLLKSKPHVIFLDEVEEAFTFWGTPEGDLVHPAECMQQLLEKVRRHRVNIDGNVCTVMVTTLVLETLLLKADRAKSLSYTIDGLMAP